ncbi:TPA: CopG family transcriptional regulator [Candidatus Geothermarchaeota archaeon]|nr:CopG family transcriptional regulator [Candidatus Geothermarchaeota archaeon]HIQ13501.1 CopG family transcriptional regulator [Thermoprotei archaeon]
MSDKVKIEISKDVYELLVKTVEESQGEFKSPEELLEFIVKETLGEEEEAYTPEEEEEIKNRLRSLGYL